jgi:hypothetical protein
MVLSSRTKPISVPIRVEEEDNEPAAPVPDARPVLPARASVLSSVKSTAPEPVATHATYKDKRVSKDNMTAVSVGGISSLVWVPAAAELLVWVPHQPVVSLLHLLCGSQQAPLAAKGSHLVGDPCMNREPCCCGRFLHVLGPALTPAAAAAVPHPPFVPSCVQADGYEKLKSLFNSMVQKGEVVAVMPFGWVVDSTASASVGAEAERQLRQVLEENAALKQEIANLKEGNAALQEESLKELKADLVSAGTCSRPPAAVLHCHSGSVTCQAHFAQPAVIARCGAEHYIQGCAAPSCDTLLTVCARVCAAAAAPAAAACCCCCAQLEFIRTIRAKDRAWYVQIIWGILEAVRRGEMPVDSALTAAKEELLLHDEEEADAAAGALVGDVIAAAVQEVQEERIGAAAELLASDAISGALEELKMEQVDAAAGLLADGAISDAFKELQEEQVDAAAGLLATDAIAAALDDIKKEQVDAAAAAAITAVKDEVQEKMKEPVRLLLPVDAAEDRDQSSPKVSAGALPSFKAAAAAGRLLLPSLSIEVSQVNCLCGKSKLDQADVYCLTHMQRSTAQQSQTSAVIAWASLRPPQPPNRLHALPSSLCADTCCPPFLPHHFTPNPRLSLSPPRQSSVTRAGWPRT